MNVIDEHCAHLRRLGRRKGSVDQRRWALQRFARHIAPSPIVGAALEDCRTFTSRPKTNDRERGLSAQRSEVVHLREFFRWCNLEGLRIDNPTLRLECPTVPAGLPRPMPGDLVKYVLANAPERQRPWFYLAVYAGLRACEIGPLRGEDFVGGDIHIRDGKGGKERTVPIPPLLLPIIKTLPRSGLCFPHQGRGDYGPTSAHQVSWHTNRWLRKERIGCTFHSLRHRYITDVYEVDGDLNIARDLAGHEDMGTTAGYAKASSKKARATVAKLPDYTPLGEEEAA